VDTRPEDIDAAMLEQLLAPHPSGVRLLSSPVRVQDADLVTGEHIPASLALAQSRFDWIVADRPHDFRDTTPAALDRAAMILVPSLPSRPPSEAWPPRRDASRPSSWRPRKPV
jgi:Flp pilus assembly CpaE family ATPase